MPVVRFLAFPSLTASAILALASFASAQVATGYGFTQNVGSYTPITGGTQVATATGASGAASMDDVIYPVILPFSFTFDGQAHTQMNISSNGFVTFGATAPTGTTYAPISASTAYAGAVAAFGRDLQGGFTFSADRVTGTNQLANVSDIGPAQVGDFLTGTGIPAGTTITAIVGNTITMSANATSTGVAGPVGVAGPWAEIRHETLGTTPNQTFVVQWSNFKRFGTTLTTTQHMKLNFQIRLDEASGAVSIAYGDCATGPTTTTTVNQVGLRGPTNAFATDVNNRRNTKGVNDDWVDSVQGTVNTSGMVFNNLTPANVIANGLTYKWIPGTPATNIDYGAGCGAMSASFYEHFTTTPSIDLSNTAFRMFNTGSGYVVMPSTSAFVAPSGTAINLNLLDESRRLVFLSAPFTFPGGVTGWFDVCDDGCVSADVGNGPATTAPTPAVMLARPQASWNVWRQFYPTATGNVWFEEVGGVAYITWLNVLGYQGINLGTATSTFQFQFHLATGHVDFVFQSMDTVSINGIGYEGWVVGYSPAGASADPGSVDLTTAVPATFVLPGADVLPLTLTASPTPALGNTVVYTTNNVPAGALYTVGVLSFGQISPGIPVLGAGDCLQFVDLSAAVLVGMLGAPSVSHSLAIPTDPLFVGATLYVQSASLVPGANALGVITSNGMASTISNF